MCMNNISLSKSKLFLFSFLFFLALFVGCSDMLGGYDRYIYGELFDIIHDHRIGLINMESEFYQSEKGYMMINYLISFITGNRYIFILIYTLLLYITIFLSFKDYMENYPIALVMFLALLFFFTFTYLRQVMAVTIVWYSVRYIYKRKLIQFLILIIFASSFHNSAFIFLPVYFMPVIKFKRKLVIIAMVVFLLLGISPLPGILFSSFGGMIGTEDRVEQYTGDYDAIGGGFRIEYIIEAVFFLYIILRNYNILPMNNKTVILQNIAIFFCGILLLFVRSSSGGRLSWYFMIGLIATVTSIIVNLSNNSITNFMKIICFLLYFRIVLYWGILLSPYKTFFTNGHRKDDYIFYKYEYDIMYDQNKFYR